MKKKLFSIIVFISFNLNAFSQWSPSLSQITGAYGAYNFDTIGNTIIYRRLISEMVNVEKISNTIPSKFTLSQNYPNPFNSKTNIKLSVPIFGNVKLTVYDLHGKEVVSLINKNLNAGIYIINFGATDFISGIYFYKLETKNFTQTKKMIIIK